MRPAMRSRPMWRVFLAGLAYLLFVGALHAAPVFPPLTGRVIDDAGILSADTQQKLTQMLALQEQQTSNQVIVATIKSLQGFSIDDYGYQLGRAWEIGQKGGNNGALLVVAPNERDVRIEVGYGLESKLTDAQSKLIIENLILPEFRKGDFNAGVLVGTTTLLRVLGGDASALPQQAERQVSNDGGASFDTQVNRGLVTHLSQTVVTSTKVAFNTLTGMQDDGTRLRVGGKSGVWNQVMGGDGEGAGWSQANNAVALGSLYYSRLGRYDNPPANPQPGAMVQAGRL